MPEANCKSLKTIHEAPLTVSVSETTDSDGSIFNPGSSPEPVFLESSRLTFWKGLDLIQTQTQLFEMGQENWSFYGVRIIGLAQVSFDRIVSVNGYRCSCSCHWCSGFTALVMIDESAYRVYPFRIVVVL